ncbi:MAG: MoaD/ThiS family protein [Gammaproteobacteria bacterium]|nr:MoaD/ThiS family protein [Gammaproteobacteria bacterium]
MRRESEDVQVPPEVGDVQALLAWLRRRDREKAYLLADDNVRVTVNRQFAEPFTRLDPGDEVGIVPVSPNPPPPPRAPGPVGDGG